MSNVLNNDYLNINPSEIIVRTMTITCKTSHTIDHKTVCDKLKMNKYITCKKYKKDGFMYIEGTPKKPIKSANIVKDSATDNKTDNKKDNKTDNTTDNKKDKVIVIRSTNNLFYNQITLEIKLLDDKIINCKVFTNGSIQMTGCRNKSDAIEASRTIVAAIRKIGGYLPNDDDKNNEFRVKLMNFDIRLINSNFRIGEIIDRYNLFNFLTKNHNFLVKFEPTDYPGVKIQYECYLDQTMSEWKREDVCEWLQNNGCKECIPKFFNNNITGSELINISHTKLKNMGIDNFKIRTKLMKLIKSKELIKKVTIIVFRTGELIITGANAMNQIYLAYNFINDVIDKNYEDLIVIESDV